ncbi:MAG: DUF3667 domain-containing protein [Sphingomonadales bacterium]|nr:DUF3667 domain-containing protein [Sphingomonadales bacterium]
MDSTIQAIGSVVDGALAARAVEPDAGEDAAEQGHFHEAACLNCGTQLVGRHCHNCGQAAHVHRTLGAFFHDLLHGLFHVEGKVWRTIPMLAWQPGQMTREYIDGRRASYVSPIALFLFSVFVTFAAFHLGAAPFRIYGMPKGNTVSAGNTSPAEMAAANARLDKAIATLKAQRAAAVAARRGEDAIDAIDTQIETLQDSREEAKAEKPVNLHTPINLHTKVNVTRSSLFGMDVTERANAAWHRAKANPELTALRMEENAHKYSWLLIPLSVPFVWLMFPFSRRFRLYDHTVFVTYSLCFMMLLQAAMVLATASGAGWLIGILVFYVPFHMHRQLRGTYALGRWGAAWRTGWLLMSALLALLFWVLALTALLVAE